MFIFKFINGKRVFGRIREGKEYEGVDSGMGFYTPCAGTRPGAADPTHCRAAYPPPRLTINPLNLKT